MFNDITVTIDQAAYDVEANQSLIQGWALDPITKSPVEIECSIPATINTMPREDINTIFGVDRDIEYGFFIQFPGSVHELKPTLTFKTDDITREYGGFAFDNQERFKPLVKAYKVLVDQGIIPKITNPIKSLKAREVKMKRPFRYQPVDRFVKWANEYEVNEWTPVETINFEKSPKLSFILTYKDREETDESLKSLNKSLNSIRNQLGGDYEIILASDSDIDEKVQLKDNESFVRGATITEAMNKAAEKASGDYMTFVDYGDEVSEHLLPELAATLEANPDYDFIYADSDKIDKFHDRYEFQFKPDYDEVLLRTHNYILQPIILKKELFNKIGGLREEYAGLQNYDLILRATKEAENIGHIPKILYHWFVLNKKVALDKKYMKEYELGIKMLEDRFNRPEDNFRLSEIDYAYDYNNTNKKDVKVAVITGVADGYNNTKAIRTAKEILSSNTNPNLEVITINGNDDVDDERFKNIVDLDSETKAELYNKAAKNTDADILVFVEPGFKAVEMSWIDELLDYVLLEDVGIVGPKFFNKAYQVEQAGIRLVNGERKDIGRSAYCRTPGFNLSLRAPKEVYAISDNCLMIEKDLFNQLNGFDESLSPDEVDIDLGIRARELGKKSVIHNNVSASIESFDNKEGASLKNLKEKYPKEVLEDNFINENFKPGKSAYNYAPVGI